MGDKRKKNLEFRIDTVNADFINPSGNHVRTLIQIRTNPVTRRHSRITLSRINEKETSTSRLPGPPPAADNIDACPFCRPQVFSMTPTFSSGFNGQDRIIRGESILFPNLYPYGTYSAVSLIDNRHYVEIGTASGASYLNSLLNCVEYLESVESLNKKAGCWAITQNHLPSAGGSLIHPHLQVHADLKESNHHRYLMNRAKEFHSDNNEYLFSAYLDHEYTNGDRYIGSTGQWEWMAAFAPEGFFEIWGIYPRKYSWKDLDETDWQNVADGVLNSQRFYRSLNRNGYNLGLISLENDNSVLELRVRIVSRSNYAPWARSDITGYEVALGDMATFTLPEKTAELARPYWGK